MSKRALTAVTVLLLITFTVSGCGKRDINSPTARLQNTESNSHIEQNNVSPAHDSINLTSELTVLTEHLSALGFEGDDFFEAFLESGGASADSDVINFIAEKLGTSGLSLDGNPFGCSTVAAESPDGERLFGRNFDWDHCDALIVKSKPKNGYASISTVNTDFIEGMSSSSLPDKAKALIALYAPLDGMNEKGLAVSVNRISDSEKISQNTEKSDLTTTTAIRLLLNKAATVDEAIKLLNKYDFHSSMNFVVHLAIADADGNSVVVEYINNEMSVVKTPIVTNFYLTQGEKYGIGTQQSHTRYEILQERLRQGAMTMDDMRDALSSVSKRNFGEFESTEWSVVFNQTTGEVHYYHRENYENKYTFTVK